MGYIKALLGIVASQEALFETFFTEEAPPPISNTQATRYGCVISDMPASWSKQKDISILVDPLISYYGYHSDVTHFSDVDLPDVIDYVLITHNHQDHILFETLLPLRHKIKHLIVPQTNSGKLEDPDLCS